MEQRIDAGLEIVSPAVSARHKLRRWHDLDVVPEEGFGALREERQIGHVEFVLGHLKKGDSRALNGDTVFEIGAVTN